MLWPAPHGFMGTTYIANAVRFGGTNEYIIRGAGWTGGADSEDGLFGTWFNFKGGDGAEQRFLSSTSTTRILVVRTSSDKLRIALRDGSGTLKWQFTSTASFNTSTNSGWNFLSCAWELDVSPVGLVYLGDSALAGTHNTGPLNASIDWTRTDWSIGASVVAASKINADVADFYLHNEFLDISVESNRRKFISGAGKPVDLGADGSNPTGTQPVSFHSGPTVNWHNNLGSGGGMTENGTLTDGASSPSD